MEPAEVATVGEKEAHRACVTVTICLSGQKNGRKAEFLDSSA
jgi:hypothetical protein